MLAAEFGGPAAITLPSAVVWADKMTAISTLVSAVILAGAIGVAIWTVLDARKTRHAELLVSLNAQWRAVLKENDATSLMRNYREPRILDLVDRLFGPGRSRRSQRTRDIEAWERLMAVVDMIETMGVLQSHGALDYDVIYDMWAAGIDDTWQQWKNAVVRVRGYTGRPETFNHFEAVGQEIERRLAIAASVASSSRAGSGTAPGKS